MPLFNLLNRPKTLAQQRDWDYAHFQHHLLIRAAVQQQAKVNLPIYPLEPTDWSKPKSFLQWNQQAHQDINGVLQLAGTDLQTVSITDPAQRSAWIELHWLEHLQWSQKLKV